MSTPANSTWPELDTLKATFNGNILLPSDENFAAAIQTWHLNPLLKAARKPRVVLQPRGLCEAVAEVWPSLSLQKSFNWGSVKAAETLGNLWLDCYSNKGEVMTIFAGPVQGQEMLLLRFKFAKALDWICQSSLGDTPRWVAASLGHKSHVFAMDGNVMLNHLAAPMQYIQPSRSALCSPSHCSTAEPATQPPWWCRTMLA